MVNVMVKLSFIIFSLILSSYSALGYPPITSDYGTNHSRNVELVKSIPEAYFDHVTQIEFTNSGFAKCIQLDRYGQMKCWKGWTWAYWDARHNCHNSRIILGEPDLKLLTHELGHIHDYCKNKNSISSEEFADNFIIK